MLERGFVVVPTGVALVAVLVVCFVRRTGARRTCLYLALTAYVGAVAAVTLFPLPVEGGMGYAPTWGISYNLVPFAGIARTVADAAQTGWWWSIATIIVGGNVLMFVPLGLMLPLLSDRLRRLPAAALVLAACSVAIELAQLVV
ncbi:MAG: VanZ family protein, partial [Gordonibacter urolithinfaciens]